MQSSELNALRNRAKRRGYRDIKIETWVEEDGKHMCRIIARDPLSNGFVCRIIEEIYVIKLLQAKRR